MKRGFALVATLALMMFLIASVSSFAFFARKAFEAERKRQFDMQSRYVAEAVCRAVAAGLSMDQNEYDSLHEEWFAREMMAIVGDYGIAVRVTPMNDRVPLAGSLRPGGGMRLGASRIWTETWGDAVLADAVSQHVRENGEPVYEDFLRWIPGVTGDILYGPDGRSGASQIMAPGGDLPGMNVNVATQEALRVVTGSSEAAALIVEARREEPIRNRRDLFAVIGESVGRGFPMITPFIRFRSSLFRADIEVSDGEFNRRFEVILTRGAGSNIGGIRGWMER